MCRDRRYSEDLWHGRIKKDQKNTVVWQIMTWTWKFRIPTGFCLIWMRWRFFAWKSPLDLGVPYFLGKPKWRLGVLAISLQIRIRSRKKKTLQNNGPGHGWQFWTFRMAPSILYPQSPRILHDQGGCGMGSTLTRHDGIWQLRAGRWSMVVVSENRVPTPHSLSSFSSLYY